MQTSAFKGKLSISFIFHQKESNVAYICVIPSKKYKMKLSHIILLTTTSLLIFNSNSSCNEVAKNSSKDGVKIQETKQQPLSENTENSFPDKTSSGICGVFVADDWDQPVPDYVLKNPDVDGVIIRIHWNNIQTAKDKFDWKQLDNDSKAIVEAGKKFWITFAAGKHSPDWIYQEGVHRLDFMESPQEGKSGKMVPVNVPIVWEKSYVELWENFISQVATHLKADQKKWDALTMVKISGINERTDEIRLPAQNKLKNERGSSTDASSIWKENGYSNDRIIKVWQRFLDAYATNFPGKVISMAVIPGHAFPTINDRGDIVGRKQFRDITEDMIRDGIKRYKGVFAVQFNSLYDTGGAHEMVVKAGKQGAITGFQLNHIKLADPACLDDHSKCDEEMFKRVMDNGANNGACWVEIFQKDVLAYPEAIKYGHNKLAK